MSAQVVSKKHIDVLVYARSIPSFWIIPEGEIDNTQLGQMLWKENMISFMARYGDAIDEDLIQSYSYTQPKMLPIVTMLKAIDYYEYQSCEHEGWKRSRSYNYCQKLYQSLPAYLPGYEEAPWGID